MGLRYMTPTPGPRPPAPPTMKPLPDLLQRVAATIERHRMFEPGHRVGVAVSGGADSVCLLHVLHRLAPRWQLCLTVLHLNHNLRGDESRADADFVRALAASLGLPAIVRQASLPPGNLEQAGRDARLALFRELIAAGTVDRVALGHTRRDQAETVLFRFLRGAGTAGLSGIRPITSDGVVRPLLDIGRDEIEAWLRARDIPWCEDSTNASPAFARNRLRHDLLPQLARDWNPQIEETLARTAEWAQAEESYWQSELDLLAPTPILHVPVLRTLPIAAARRLIRRATEHVKGDLRSIDFSHIESILALAQARAGHGAVDLPGLQALRSFDQIRLSPYGAPAPESYSFPVKLPGPWTPVPGPPVLLELVEKPETSPLSDYVYNGEMGCLDWGRLSGSLVLRNWNPGDCFQPVGSAGPRKIKSLFHSARIPFWERAQWPVLADGASVVWTRRFGVAAGAAASDRTRVILRVREIETPAAAVPPKSESGSGELASNM
jgi:tRNA(Ile)-lysidine synthase